MAGLQTHVWRTTVGDDDLPEDRFANHVNNARFFYFINLTFRSWYIAMGLRGAAPTYTAVMVRSEYDFLGEVTPPRQLECRITVVRVGRSSMEHAVEIYDLGPTFVGQNLDGVPRLVGQGRVVHVCLRRADKSTVPWPAELLRLCWHDRDAPTGPAATGA